MHLFFKVKPLIVAVSLACGLSACSEKTPQQDANAETVAKVYKIGSDMTFLFFVVPHNQYSA